MNRSQTAALATLTFGLILLGSPYYVRGGHFSAIFAIVYLQLFSVPFLIAAVVSGYYGTSAEAGSTLNYLAEWTITTLSAYALAYLIHNIPKLYTPEWVSYLGGTILAGSGLLLWYLKWD